MLVAHYYAAAFGTGYSLYLLLNLRISMSRYCGRELLGSNPDPDGDSLAPHLDPPSHVLLVLHVRCVCGKSVRHSQKIPENTKL